jgi:L-threonylcarbamoyladenylate synthase
MTQIWRLRGEPPAKVIEELAHLLRNGGVALLPTDTIYGLHAVAANERAIERIVEAKGRGSDKPFIVLGASTGQLRNSGVFFPAETLAALEQLWPGPLTAVLPIVNPTAASCGTATLAVRIPALEWLRNLVSLTGPLASTSANVSGEPPLCSPEELSERLAHAIDAIVDLGRLEGKPSVIVDFTGDEARLIREGESFFTQKVRKTLRKSL